jgi:threonyl-tRNA synthetase
LQPSNSHTVISVYTQDTFTDLCRGPHVQTTSEINPAAFKISQSSGAYWRGDEKKPMLQRIYGVAFETEKELDDYTHMMEEAKRRDHRKLGAELDIFIFDDEVGPGLPLWLPNGGVMIEQIEALAKKMEDEALTLIQTRTDGRTSQKSSCSSAAGTCRITPRACSRP